MSGCVSEEVLSLGNDTSQGTSTYVIVADVPPERSESLDLLFVVDNSAGMTEHQRVLGNSFAGLVSHLQHSEGGMPNTHVGVISSDLGDGGFRYSGCDELGDRGALQADPACGTADAYLALERTAPDQAVQSNAAVSIEDAFACMADLGGNGCTISQPLEAMRLALTGSAQNQGFLRDEAALAVVFVTASDDCSAVDPGVLFDPSLPGASPVTLGDPRFRCYQFGVTCPGDDIGLTAGEWRGCEAFPDSAYMVDVNAYAETLRGLKETPGKIVVTSVMGDPDTLVIEEGGGGMQVAPQCPEALGGARPGVRLHSLVERFDRAGESRSICGGVESAMTGVAQQIRRALGTVCLEGAIADSAPEIPGRQPDCLVWDERASGERTAIVACDSPWELSQSSATPCYALKTGLAECGLFPTQLGVEVWRGGAPQPADTRVVVECVVDAE